MRLSDVFRWEAVGLLKGIRGHDDRLLPRTLAFSEKPSADSSQLVEGLRAITLTHPRERVRIGHEVKHVQVGAVGQPQLAQCPDVLGTRWAHVVVLRVAEVSQEYRGELGRHICDQRPVPSFRDREYGRLCAGEPGSDPPRG